MKVCLICVGVEELLTDGADSLQSSAPYFILTCIIMYMKYSYLLLSKLELFNCFIDTH